MSRLKTCAPAMCLRQWATLLPEVCSVALGRKAKISAIEKYDWVSFYCFERTLLNQVAGFSLWQLQRDNKNKYKSQLQYPLKEWPCALNAAGVLVFKYWSEGPERSQVLWVVDSRICVLCVVCLCVSVCVCVCVLVCVFMCEPGEWT